MKVEMKVWYMKKEWFNQLICHPEEVKKSNIEKTHSIVFEAPFNNLNEVFEYMNIDFPALDRRAIIRNAGCSHTSMSVGDVVQIGDNYYAIKGVGWKTL